MSTRPAAETSIRTSIVVEAPIEQALTPERTRVELEHRHLERHGDGWKGLREGVRGDQGWPLYLERFATLANA